MKPRPRLLFVVHSAKPAGAQYVALRQVGALREAFELFISIPDGPLKDEFAAHGTLVPPVRSLPIWGEPRWRWALMIARVLPNSLRLARVIRRRRIEAIVTNSVVLAAPVLAARLTRRPVLVHAQEAPKTAAARRIYRFHTAMADVIVAPSSWIEETVRGAGRATVVRIPNGVSIPAERPPVPRFESRLRLCVIGTIDAHKRQDVAVEALARLRRRGHDAVLELVGPEHDERFAGRVRSLVDRHGLRDRVTFTGETMGIDDVLLRSDVLLLPAGEVTPLVLMQALAHQRGVVAADMGSVADIVVHGRTGLLVAPGSAAEMADAVETLAGAPDEARRMAVAGRRHVENLFDESTLHHRLAGTIDRHIALSAASR